MNLKSKTPYKLSKADKAKMMRSRKPALKMFNYQEIHSKLYEISEAANDIAYHINTNDDTILAALDGDEEAEYELKMTAVMCGAKAEKICEQIIEAEYNWRLLGDGDLEQTFNDCLVSLIGAEDCCENGGYALMGYDYYEDDYFDLIGYDKDIAVTEAGKRIMARTKKDMIYAIGKCLGIFISVYDLYYQWAAIEDTVAFLRDEQLTLLDAVKNVEKLYDDMMTEKAEKEWWEEKPTEKDFDRCVNYLPERMWIE